MIFGGISNSINFLFSHAHQLILCFCKNCTSAKVQKPVIKHLACIELYCEVDIKDIFIVALHFQLLHEGDAKK